MKQRHCTMIANKIMLEDVWIATAAFILLRADEKYDE
jgi:hypothetical protein